MTYLRSKLDNKNTIIKYSLIIIPLIVYGIYKNGFLLFQRDYINIFSVFKPLYLLGISIIINGFWEFVLNKKIEFNYSYLNIGILTLFLMPNINILLYSVILFGGVFLKNIIVKRININEIAFLKLFVVLIVSLVGSYSYLNLAEANNIYAYNLLDLICGRNTGGISSTSILLGLIIYAYLSYNTNYKRVIPLLSYLVYMLVCIPIILFSNLDYTIVFNSTVILAFILVATDNKSTPYKFKGQIIYSVLLGLLTCLLSIKLPFEGVFISIFVLSIFNRLFDKIKN